MARSISTMPTARPTSSSMSWAGTDNRVDSPPRVQGRAAGISLLTAPWVLVLTAALAFIAYGSGLGVGFVSDDHYWLLSAVQGGWRKAFDLAPHSSALPFELLLHSVKY